MKRFTCSVLLLAVLFMTIFHGSALAAEKFKVGDKVHLKTSYNTKADGSGSKHKGADVEYYIIAKIRSSAKYPYALQPAGKDKIVGWAKDSAILHDYTDEIFEGFLSELEKDSGFLRLNDSSQLIVALTTYFKHFNDYEKYDVKREAIWEAMFSVSFPGTGKKFWFNGYEMTPEDLGNYLYAAAGSKWGFSGKMIHQAAGYGQQKTTAYFNRPDQYYGDNKDDYEWIERGIHDFSTNVKWDLDLAELAKNTVLWDVLMGMLEKLR